MQHEGHENVCVLMPQGRGMRRENPILPAYFPPHSHPSFSGTIGNQ